MTIQEMKDRKRELGLSNEEIALRSGVPFSTVQKIFGGITTSPRSKTIKALEAVLSRVEQKGSIIQEESLIQEEPLAYRTKKQGEYTLEDYYAIPDERRVELIDGVLYDMETPSVIHQRILGLLHLLFEECISSHEGDCEVFLSPCDVQLDRDEKTMLQPDLFVLCREYDLKGRSIPGAPDLTV